MKPLGTGRCLKWTILWLVACHVAVAQDKVVQLDLSSLAVDEELPDVRADNILPMTTPVLCAKGNDSSVRVEKDVIMDGTPVGDGKPVLVMRKRPGDSMVGFAFEVSDTSALRPEGKLSLEMKGIVKKDLAGNVAVSFMGSGKLISFFQITVNGGVQLIDTVSNKVLELGSIPMGQPFGLIKYELDFATGKASVAVDGEKLGESAGFVTSTPVSGVIFGLTGVEQNGEIAFEDIQMEASQ